MIGANSTPSGANCDGSGPHSRNPEVRILPAGGAGNLILCLACYLRELDFRRERNKEEKLTNENAFPLPAWNSLKVYGAE